MTCSTKRFSIKIYLLNITQVTEYESFLTVPLVYNIENHSSKNVSIRRLESKGSDRDLKHHIALCLYDLIICI